MTLKHHAKIGVHRKQELFLDAIEYSFQMIQIAYQRLVKDCRDLSDKKITENGMLASRYRDEYA